MPMKSGSYLVTALLVVVGFLVIYPLFMLFFGSFKGGPPGTSTPFTIQGYITAYTNPVTFSTLWTTAWLGLIRTVLAASLAIFFAWVITRTDTPWRGLLEVLIWIKFFLPGLPLVVAWILLLGETGFINQFLMQTFHLNGPLLNVFSYGGIIWVSVISWTALIFILIVPAFRGMDAALEESSRMAGANTFTTIRRVTVPVLMPAILGATMLAFIRIMESFEVELFLGYGAGIYVYTTRIWWLLGLASADFPQAMALSSVFLVIVMGLIILQGKVLGSKQFVTVTGRGFAIRPMRLGRWRYVTLSIVLLWFFIAAVLPIAVLILGTFMRLWGIWVEDPFTLKHWIRTLGDSQFWFSLKNTLYLGIGAATGGMLLYSIISYIVTKTKHANRKALDVVSWLPWGVPSLVLAIGFLWAYVGGLPFLRFIYGSIWLLMLVFLVRGLPLGVRVMNGAMVQMGNELEESSRVLGGSWIYTFRRILAPLLSGSFISAWIIVFMLTARDLVTVVLLYTPSSRLLTTKLFEHWTVGEYERATVVGLILTLLTLIVALIARFIGTKQQVVSHM